MNNDDFVTLRRPANRGRKREWLLDHMVLCKVEYGFGTRVAKPEQYKVQVPLTCNSVFIPFKTSPNSASELDGNVSSIRLCE